MNTRAFYIGFVSIVVCILLWNEKIVCASLFEKGYYDYEGTVGQDLQIQMSLYPLVREIVGSHFYEMFQYPMTLKGKVEGNEITLYEFDQKGNGAGVFKGTVSAGRRSRNIINNLFIRGTWSSLDGKKTLPFSLKLKYTVLGAEYGKRYKVAGATDDVEVEKEIKLMQQHILRNDKEFIADMTHYPVNISSIDRRRMTINTKEEFLNNYEKIFSTEFKRILGDAFAMNMRVNSEGIRFAEDPQNIWLKYYTVGKKSVLMISKINY